MRDYKRENETKEKRTERFNGFIPKQKGLQFKTILKDKNIVFSKWLEEKIDEFLQKN